MAHKKINSSILKTQIMIIDDSAISRRKLKNDLSNRGFDNIIEANSGIEALELLPTSSPELFLVDMLMPGMNGNELVKHLRALEKHTDTPIIIVTVSEEEELIKECFTLGANDFLRKPWDADELTMRVCSQIERLQNIQYFKEDNLRLAHALEIITDGIWEYNIEKDEIAFNPSCYRILNISEDLELTVNYMRSLIHPEDKERIFKLFASAILSSKTSVDFECRVNIGDDTYRWLSTKCKITEYSPNGSAKLLIGVTKDITSQIIAQKHLQKFGKEMRELAEERSDIIIHNERLAALGTMSAGIAHEISNPLSYIKGNIQLLMKTIPNIFQAVSSEAISDEHKHKLYEGLENVDSVLSSLEDGIHRVCDIAETMKNFSSKHSDTMKVHDIAEAIDDALLLCTNYTKHGVKIRKEYQNNEFRLAFNIQQITQVLVNLIINAVHAMHNNGILTITTEKADSELLLKISDTGTGIKESVREQLFDAFFTTKKEGEGTGLGLYISKNIITEHNGRITVENNVKAGTTFKIYLPLGEEAEEKDSKSKGQEDDPGLLNILIAEDDLLIQEIIIQKFKIFSCNTVVTTKVEDTVKIVKDKNPDAVVLSMSATTPDSVFKIMKELHAENLLPSIFVIEAEHNARFPIEKLKEEVEIYDFDSFEVLSSKDLGEIFE